MIEIVVVIAIIGLLTAMAVPALQRYRAVEDAKANVQVVATALREARTRALRTGVQHIGLFNPDAGDTELVARIIRDTDGNREESPGDVGVDVRLARVRSAGVNPYGRDSAPFPDAAVVDGDALGGTLGVVVDGAHFPNHFDGDIPAAVGFTSRGVTFQVTAPANPIVVGSGSGAYYVTDGQAAVYAAIVLPLGEVRVRAYSAGTDQWR